MSFTSDVNKVVKQIKGDQEKIIKLSAIELFRRLVFGSPVGNPSEWEYVKRGGKPPEGYTGGHFRNNWFLSFNAPSTKDDRPASKAGGGSVGELRKIGASNSSTFYFTNNLPYSEAIELGHSQQAPSGVLRKNAKSWQRIVDQVGARVNR